IAFVFLITSTIVSISSTGTYSGSVPLNPSITAKSVACPTPVSDKEPYKSTRRFFALSNQPLFLISRKKLSAARHGPSVCELDGPTPIFNISNTEMYPIPFYLKYTVRRYRINLDKQ